MKVVSSIQEAVRHGLCISCAACVSAAPPGTIKIVLDQNRGIFVPQIVDPAQVHGDGREFAVCPGKGYDIHRMAQDLYGSATHHSFELGRYRLGIAAHSTNQRILEKASSGGVMTGIAHYLLEKNLVQGVTASRFIYGAEGPRTESFIARSLEMLLSAQGSKYCPTYTNRLVRECMEAGGQYLFIGTPCQVGALRLATQQNRALADVFPYTMANFCAGYRDFRYLDELLLTRGIKPSEVTYFRFRGGGQPGSMLAVTRNGRAVTCPYPEYEFNCSKIRKQKRCWYCVDATGELADFACGDAWIKRFREDRYPWSIILARSAFAEQIVNEMSASNKLKVAKVSFEEICQSQKSNIGSKKFRQFKRMRVSQLLGIRMPLWDVELPRDRGSYLHELFVLFGKTVPGQWLRKGRYLISKCAKRR